MDPSKLRSAAPTAWRGNKTEPPSQLSRPTTPRSQLPYFTRARRCADAGARFRFVAQLHSIIISILHETARRVWLALRLLLQGPLARPRAALGCRRAFPRPSQSRPSPFFLSFLLFFCFFFVFFALAPSGYLS